MIPGKKKVGKKERVEKKTETLTSRARIGMRVFNYVAYDLPESAFFFSFSPPFVHMCGLPDFNEAEE